jgi:hypothetical protein
VVRWLSARRQPPWPMSACTCRRMKSLPRSVRFCLLLVSLHFLPGPRRAVRRLDQREQPARSLRPRARRESLRTCGGGALRPLKLELILRHRGRGGPESKRGRRRRLQLQLQPHVLAFDAPAAGGPEVVRRPRRALVLPIACGSGRGRGIVRFDSDADVHSTGRAARCVRERDEQGGGEGSPPLLALRLCSFGITLPCDQLMELRTDLFVIDDGPGGACMRNDAKRSMRHEGEEKRANFGPRLYA